MPKAKADVTSPIKFWLAVMETSNFTFKGTGLTQEEAQKALVAGWKQHRTQSQAHGATNMPAANIYALDEAFGVNYFEFEPGQCWRDYDVISPVA